MLLASPRVPSVFIAGHHGRECLRMSCLSSDAKQVACLLHVVCRSAFQEPNGARFSIDARLTCTKRTEKYLLFKLRFSLPLCSVIKSHHTCPCSTAAAAAKADARSHFCFDAHRVSEEIEEMKKEIACFSINMSHGFRECCCLTPFAPSIVSE